MSIQEDPANNTLHLFIPKCRICQSTMKRWDMRGITKQNEMGTASFGNSTTGRLQEAIDSTGIAPSITYLVMIYRCPKHEEFFRADPSMIEAMNRYPPGQIVYHHVVF